VDSIREFCSYIFQDGIFTVHEFVDGPVYKRVKGILVFRKSEELFHLRISVPDALHIFEQNLLAAAVIEFSGPAVGVAGDTLSGFQGAVIFQKIRDAGCPE
jgi:hypothetical protein